MTKITYLQELWPANTCYGCGPCNPDGLQIKSQWSDDGCFVTATYMADPKYNAGIPDLMYGGTVASLIDCHSIWTAIAFFQRAENQPIGEPPTVLFVTQELSIKYLKPTPLSQCLYLKAWVEGDIGRKIHVVCELGTADVVTARGDVTAARLS